MDLLLGRLTVRLPPRLRHRSWAVNNTIPVVLDNLSGCQLLTHCGLWATYQADTL